MRPVEETLTRPRKKNGRSDPQEVAREVDQLLRVVFSGRRKTGRMDSGGGRDGWCVRPCITSGAAALTELLQFPGSGRRSAAPFLAACGHPARLPGVALQAGADGGGPGESVASLLLVLALSHRPVPRRCRTGHRKHGVLSRRAPHAGGGGPGGALRPRPPADETAGRSGGDHQSRGAHGGGHRGGYRRARAGGDPARPCSWICPWSWESRFPFCTCKWTGPECRW